MLKQGRAGMQQRSQTQTRTKSAKRLLPGLSEVDDVDTIHRAAKDVALHAEVNIASAQVGLANLGCK